MDVLLDTCAVLWAVSSPALMAERARQVLADAGTAPHVCAISRQLLVEGQGGQLASETWARIKATVVSSASGR